MENHISTSTHKCGNGFIGEIILQRPASYNALSSEKFRGLLSILGQWEKRRDIFFNSKALDQGEEVKGTRCID